MPSWKLPLLLPFINKSSSSKQSSPSSSSATSTSSTSSSSASSPTILTPASSTVCLSPTPPKQVNEKVNTRSGRRLRRRNGKTVDTPPGPVQPRLSSLFFPTTYLTPEQETKCTYRASFAASLSDLLSPSLGRRPVSGFWNGGAVPEAEASSFDLGLDGAEGSENGIGIGFGYKQSNLTSPVLGLQLDSNPYPLQPRSFSPIHTTQPTRSYRSSYHFTQSVDHLGLGDSTSPHVRFSTAPRDPYLVLAPLSSGQHQVSRKSVDYSSMMTRKERSYSTSGGTQFGGMQSGTEIWSSPYDSDLDLPSTSQMAPPPVPARSNLRPSASASNLRDRFSRTGQSSNSTPFTLPVDQPSRPGLSPSTSSRSQETQHPVTPTMITSPSMESAFSIGRRKRPSAARGGSISGDPMRIKDGATARESTSGVYTPPTFPGVQGYQNARPREPSSKIYTPPTFNLPSPSIITRPAPSPSRSTSVSSTSTASSFGEVTTPRTPHTPLTPGSRFLGAVSGGWGSAVTGIKRASATLSTRSSNSSPSAPSSHTYTPTSAREGYFPPTIYESSTTTTTTTTTSSAASTPLAPSLWPSTTGGGKKPYGLGLGLGAGSGSGSEEEETRNTSGGEKFGGALVGDVPKSKRKPVPKPSGTEGIKEEVEAEVEIIHAM